jgi:hypothetical protein
MSGRCEFADDPDATCECRDCMTEAIRREAERDGITPGDWLKSEDRLQYAADYDFDPEELDLTNPEWPTSNGKRLTIEEAKKQVEMARIGEKYARNRGFISQVGGQTALEEAEQRLRYVRKLTRREG